MICTIKVREKKLFIFNRPTFSILDELTLNIVQFSNVTKKKKKESIMIVRDAFV